MDRKWTFPASMNPTEFGSKMQIIVFANPNVEFVFKRNGENIEVRVLK